MLRAMDLDEGANDCGCPTVYRGAFWLLRERILQRWIRSGKRSMKIFTM